MSFPNSDDDIIPLPPSNLQQAADALERFQDSFDQSNSLDSFASSDDTSTDSCEERVVKETAPVFVDKNALSETARRRISDSHRRRNSGYNSSSLDVLKHLSEPHLNDQAHPHITSLRKDVIGRDILIPSPFGAPRKLTYCDFTASGRSLRSVENTISNILLPIYANTHTEASYTGAYTTRIREEARTTIKRLVGAGSNDKLIFTGYGVTGAIDKLMRLLGLNVNTQPSSSKSSKGACSKGACSLTNATSSARPDTDYTAVVFVGPYEHHSNIVPWRESPQCKVVQIQETSVGQIDLAHLEQELIENAGFSLKIGSFSAASNVTGILTDTRSLSVLLHRHRAFAFFDYATAAPYVSIKMNGDHTITDDSSPFDYKDAVFISPHKFVGGPGSPGILLAKRHLFINRVPSVPGGGTVSYVSPTGHDYYDSVEHREEGGTPSIIGAVRAALAMKVKHEVGIPTIHKYEQAYITRAIDEWTKSPFINILGNPNVPRLGIVSFVVKYKNSYYHHNFIVALLNDLFGIQSRGGCACAGPYGHSLLGVSNETSEKFREQIVRGYEGIKPGWTRVNFPYFLSEAQFRFIVQAVLFVAEHAHVFLPWYTFHPVSGLWRHINYVDDERVPHFWDIQLLNIDPVSCSSSSSSSEQPVDGDIKKTRSTPMSKDFLSIDVRKSQSVHAVKRSRSRSPRSPSRSRSPRSPRFSAKTLSSSPKASSPLASLDELSEGNDELNLYTETSPFSSKRGDAVLQKYLSEAERLVSTLKPPKKTHKGGISYGM
mmetsp:Transcript_21038/g.31305  ORF Transcript_21038/g.31305 Transcript_21038/m.31305 type:complete len:773 (+) Transcript_21038:1-2319(+)